jgi:hypothetical protein
VASTTQLIRLWNGATSDHFFTTDVAEANNAASGGYVKEALAPMFIYPSQLCGSLPLYRSWSASKTDHFYTTSQTERDSLTGYAFELIAGYVLPLNTTSSSGSGSDGLPVPTSLLPSDSSSASAPCVQFLVHPLFSKLIH